ncbi:hypothetical protein [Nocardioides sp. B-3]|uniref:hypothetical protein n=1 Tax=Nocardioides sp. B-3 TaxID=2895565 RepID=UPI0021520C27|nr:hypothetical protein [Nocardioides sp. B-3]UUZ59027.1 hypothetical protein LP418_24075 [Nocardioides sp. B-3]
MLLIDELDRADDEFDAFLLEVLSEQALTIPEIGTISAPSPPIVFITSNRTRTARRLEASVLLPLDRLPPPEREAEIIRKRVPSVEPELAHAIASAVTGLRELGLVKQPGIAEAIDWALATSLMGGPAFDSAIANLTVGAAIKNREDSARVTDLLPGLYSPSTT